MEAEMDRKGAPGVCFLLFWIFLIVLRLCMGRGALSSTIFIAGSALGAGAAVWFLRGRIRRQGYMAALDDDIDFILCAVTLFLDVLCCGMMVVQMLHFSLSRAGLIFLALVFLVNAVLRIHYDNRRGHKSVRD
jgi:hypothetical protein